ncbi:alpha/beta hydrolase family protein [Pseudonocardia sp. HH130630-07]|uniref:alpha/beta hydrolase family protein n=1 Tax=Pseudonocardia sp. HH130630-07 TaxID=1690815 RepID=UPI00081502C0|nr:alpha/beta family hydrolase [Pseudonocardia sp. HH130630-07]ANY07610.1 alpha/beta hydrolase [Pseudonocardia sp. HH130630-07]
MNRSADVVGTPRGPARVTLHRSGSAGGLLLLGHGAGGGIEAPDLVAATTAATAAGFDVGLVEQPYRVAGRRAPAPAGHLDEAWTAVAAAVSDGRPLVVGGRSSGARVACRTAPVVGAAGVLCLAFPLVPPGRPEKTRQPELDGAGVPVLVVQGRSDRFGVPGPGPDRAVVLLDGDHGLKKQHGELRDAVGDWLGRVLRQSP